MHRGPRQRPQGQPGTAIRIVGTDTNNLNLQAAAEHATPLSSFVCGVSQLTQPCSNRLKATTVVRDGDLVQQHSLHNRLALCTGPAQQIPPLPHTCHWPVSAPTTTHTRHNNAHSSIHTLCKTNQASRTDLPAKTQPQPSATAQAVTAHQDADGCQHHTHHTSMDCVGRATGPQRGTTPTRAPLPPQHALLHTAHNHQTHALHTYNRHSINTYTHIIQAETSS